MNAGVVRTVWQGGRLLRPECEVLSCRVPGSQEGSWGVPPDPAARVTGEHTGLGEGAWEHVS